MLGGQYDGAEAQGDREDAGEVRGVRQATERATAQPTKPQCLPGLLPDEQISRTDRPKDSQPTQNNYKVIAGPKIAPEKRQPAISLPRFSVSIKGHSQPACELSSRQSLASNAVYSVAIKQFTI